MCAEGSDWFWWYGDDNFTIYFKEFDELFRNHLKRSLELAGFEVPPFLYEPIKREAQNTRPDVEAVSFITPKIDGIMENYFEYLGAGEFNVAVISTGQVKTKSYFLEKIYYGFDRDNFYLALKPLPGKEMESLEILFDNGQKIGVNVKEGTSNPQVDFAYKKILEIAIPLSLIGLRDEIKFSLLVKGEGMTELYPRFGYFKIKRLTEEESDIAW